MRTEEKVIKLLKEGLTDKEIAQRVNLSASGVGYHVQKLYRKAGLFSSADHRRLMVWLFKQNGNLTGG